jgi:transcriptional regulator with XRE-family HTH domain
LAEFAGISPGYLSEVERGSSAPSGEKLARIASELGVSTDYLLTGVTSTTAPVQVPAGLAAAAEQLNLTYAQTMRLLAGKRSLVARRSSGEQEDDWAKADWIEFYKKVSPYL